MEGCGQRARITWRGGILHSLPSALAGRAWIGSSEPDDSDLATKLAASLRIYNTRRMEPAMEEAHPGTQHRRRSARLTTGHGSERLLLADRPAASPVSSAATLRSSWIENGIARNRDRPSRGSSKYVPETNRARMEGFDSAKRSTSSAPSRPEILGFRTRRSIRRGSWPRAPETEDSLCTRYPARRRAVTMSDRGASSTIVTRTAGYSGK